MSLPQSKYKVCVYCLWPYHIACDWRKKEKNDLHILFCKIMVSHRTRSAHHSFRTITHSYSERSETSTQNNLIEKKQKRFLVKILNNNNLGYYVLLLPSISTMHHCRTIRSKNVCGCFRSVLRSHSNDMFDLFSSFSLTFCLVCEGPETHSTHSCMRPTGRIRIWEEKEKRRQISASE